MLSADNKAHESTSLFEDDDAANDAAARSTIDTKEINVDGCNSNVIRSN
jgi:hypothetical protein